MFFGVSMTSPAQVVSGPASTAGKTANCPTRRYLEVADRDLHHPSGERAPVSNPVRADWHIAAARTRPAGERGSRVHDAPASTNPRTGPRLSNRRRALAQRCARRRAKPTATLLASRLLRELGPVRHSDSKEDELGRHVERQRLAGELHQNLFGNAVLVVQRQMTTTPAIDLTNVEIEQQPALGYLPLDRTGLRGVPALVGDAARQLRHRRQCAQHTL